ncbi:MAG: S9 family peptidase [Acidobacteriota bacterium]
MRTCTRTLLAVLALAGLALQPAGAQDKRPLTFVEAIEIPSVQDPQISPDGRQIVFVMDQADWKANRRVQHLYRIGADGTGQVQLTFGERGESSPRWSPDGRHIAFLARRDSDQHNQIYLLPADGGEARRVTTHPTAPGSLSWSPDGSAIYFVAADALSPEAREKRRLQDDVYAFEEDNFEQRHLWATDLDGKTRAITSGRDFSVLDYTVSMDGKRVAMMRAPSPLLEHGRFAEVWVMDLDGQNAVRLTTNEIRESNPQLSPDGSQVLFTADANAQFESYHNDKIFLVPAAGGPARVATPSAASYEVENATWSKDGRSIYFTANHGVHNQVMRLDPATGQSTALTTGDHMISSWSYADAAGAFVFTRSGADRPSEVYLLGADGGTARRVTAVHDALVNRVKVARQERITWKGKDGQTVEGLLFYPVDYSPGQRYPLVVWTHGGPAASDKFNFSSEAQVYAGRNIAVLKPNYRGSTGYGDAFLRDMVKGYFKNAHLDVLLGADAVIAMGVADPDRLLKTGWSAGGHMTNKIITFTDRFKAAVSGAGAANWISMYAQSDHRAFRTPWFGGTPWQQNAPIDLYWDHSPLKDAWKVRTPTLFLVGEADPRVPMPQSVEMYRALKYNGVTTRLGIAPREGHGWQELRHKLHELNARMDWLVTHGLKGTYTWEQVPGDNGAPRPTTTASQ